VWRRRQGTRIWRASHIECRVRQEWLRAARKSRVRRCAAASKREAALRLASALGILRLDHDSNANRRAHRWPAGLRPYRHAILAIANVLSTRQPVVARTRRAVANALRERSDASSGRPVARRQRTVEANLNAHRSLRRGRLAQVVDQVH
jgi:hypothetical protein